MGVLGYELNSADYHFGEAHVALKNGNGPGIFLMETNDLLALHERLKQAGAHIDKEPVFTNDFGYFTFYDPDGHYIRAVEERGVFRLETKNEFNTQTGSD